MSRPRRLEEGSLTHLDMRRHRGVDTEPLEAKETEAEFQSPAPGDGLCVSPSAAVHGGEKTALSEPSAW